MVFKSGVIQAVKGFKKSFPYKVGRESRELGMRKLIECLANIYQIAPVFLMFINPEREHSFDSYAIPSKKLIVMDGKLSIITLLHEFAHIRGMNEEQAREWSVELFKRCYPNTVLMPYGTSYVAKEVVCQN